MGISTWRTSGRYWEGITQRSGCRGGPVECRGGQPAHAHMVAELSVGPPLGPFLRYSTSGVSPDAPSVVRGGAADAGISEGRTCGLLQPLGGELSVGDGVAVRRHDHTTDFRNRIAPAALGRGGFGADGAGALRPCSSSSVHRIIPRSGQPSPPARITTFLPPMSISPNPEPR
jgi:hypothetical protein